MNYSLAICEGVETLRGRPRRDARPESCLFGASYRQAGMYTAAQAVLAQFIQGTIKKPGMAAGLSYCLA